MLFAVFGLLAGANSAYLSAITFLEWLHRPTLYRITSTRSCSASIWWSASPSSSLPRLRSRPHQELRETDRIAGPCASATPSSPLDSSSSSPASPSPASTSSSSRISASMTPKPGPSPYWARVAAPLACVWLYVPPPARRTPHPLEARPRRRQRRWRRRPCHGPPPFAPIPEKLDHLQGGCPLLPTLQRQDRLRQLHPRRELHDGRLLQVPRGRLRRLVPQFPPLQLIQQPLLSLRRQRNPPGRPPAGRGCPRLPLLRRLP